MARKPNTPEALALISANPLTVFYTEKKDKDITAIASYYKRKIMTERLIIVSGSKDNPVARTLTKVTIL